MSMEEVNQGLVQSRDQVDMAVQLISRSTDNLADAWNSLGTSPNDSELLSATQGFHEAHTALQGIAQQLAAYTEIVNPYMSSVGLPALAPVTAIQPQNLEQHSLLRDEADPEVFSTYQDTGKRLREQTAEITKSDPDAPIQMDGYIASGSQHHVFELPDGKNVIKVPIFDGVHNTDLSSWEFVREMQEQGVEALQRAKGHDGLEQIVAYVKDETTGSIICEKVPGTTVNNMQPEEFNNVPQEHFDKLIKTLGTVDQLGLFFDDLGASENVIYHPDKGFTLISTS